MIKELAGVVIWTENVIRLKTFYEDILGLCPNSVRKDFVSYKWDKVKFSIGKHALLEGTSSDQYRIMINFNVDDIHHTTEQLKRHGVQFMREPEQEHWGGHVATFTDPDQNIIQLLQQPFIDAKKS